MNSRLFAVLTSTVLAGIILGSHAVPASGWQQLPPGHPPIEQQLPPGHPPLPGMEQQLPPGHPPLPGSGIGGANTTQQWSPPLPAKHDDVQSAEHIVSAYYDVVSGGKGVTRDWDRFRSLFIAEGRLIAAQPLDAFTPCAVLTPEQFAQMNDAYFERGGYFERDVHRRVESFGNMAHVFSTYEARRAEDDAEPYSRGVNSFQLVFSGDRWWIVTVMWDYEREGVTIPQPYLPASVD